MSKITSDQIKALLQHKYPAPEWATFTELATATGGVCRYIDFFAFNVWRSGQYRRVSFEIKVSASDFKREIKHPQKRWPAEELSNECYFVAPAGVVDIDLLPKGWGYMLVTEEGDLKTIMKAVHRELSPPPMSFMASLARRSQDPSPILPQGIWVVSGQELTEQDMFKRMQAEIAERVRLEMIKPRIVKGLEAGKACEYFLGRELPDNWSLIYDLLRKKLQEATHVPSQ